MALSLDNSIRGFPLDAGRMSLISVSRSAAFSGAFPLFSFQNGSEQSRAEGWVKESKSRTWPIFLFTVLVFVFVARFPEMGWGLKGKSWLVR